MENGVIAIEKPSIQLNELENGGVAGSRPPPTPPPPISDKSDEIQLACKEKDTSTLILLATSREGLLNDSFRRIAWPLLLGCCANTGTKAEDAAWQQLPRHRDEDQVKLDVDRAFVYYPNDRTVTEIESKKIELSNIITAVLRLHPMLCYFQGYHDIVQVLLLVLGVQDAIPAVTRISFFRIRDYMLPSLSPAVSHLRLVPAILKAADQELFQRLSQTKPFFALAATLTLYAHDIQEYSDIARLFDFLLAHEPVVSLYLFVAIVLSRKKELLDIPLDEPEMLHYTLSKLPNPLDLESLILQAIALYELYPPNSLPLRAWNSLSKHSVLKTSRDFTLQSEISQGEKLFQKQARELKLQEYRQKAVRLLWHYRKPVGSVGLTVIVGVMSFWFRRTGNDRLLWSFFERLWRG